jgi:hypothetical protein
VNGYVAAGYVVTLGTIALYGFRTIRRSRNLAGLLKGRATK